MKRCFLFPLAGFFLFYSGCAGVPDKQISRPVPVENTAQTEERFWTITDYPGKNVDSVSPTQGGAEAVFGEQELPPWLLAWLKGGNAAVEALDEYSGEFVFVALNSGTNANALKQWQDGFSPELDFPRLAALRIEKRFLASAALYPDDQYGAYFETIIRAVSDFFWEGAVRKEDFWLKRQINGAEEAAESGPPESPLIETYEFFVLLAIEKEVFVPQMDALLLNARPAPPLTRDQSASVESVRENFYQGF